MDRTVAGGLLFGALLAAVGCYLRADYNVPVLLFCGLLWDFKPHVRATLVSIVLWTWVVDTVWLITHLALWRSDSASTVVTRLHNLTLLIGAAIFLLKLILLGIMLLTSEQARHSLKPIVVWRSVKRRVTDW